MQERRSNADRRQETRAALLAAGRALFLDNGYAETGTPDIVRQAGVTRGALYHHFSDKQALFQAVVEAEAAQIAAEINAGSSAATTPLDALLDGARSYFRAMQRPGRVRLMLLDGPVVLGPERMRRIDQETGGLTLRQGLAQAMGGEASEAEIAILADLMAAVFDRAVMAGQSGADTAAYEAAIARLLSAILP